MVFDVAEGSDDVSLQSHSSDVSDEVKNRHFFTANDYSQILAQTIVFSFLQNKINASWSLSSLVPGIGISAKKLIISMYDCQEDVLLQSKPMDLCLLEGGLNCRTIVYLWLVLNHKLFCTGIPEQLKMYKAQFHDHLGPDYLKLYTKEVTKPFHSKPCCDKQLPEFENEPAFNPVVLKILSEIKKKVKYEDCLESISLKKEIGKKDET